MKNLTVISLFLVFLFYGLLVNSEPVDLSVIDNKPFINHKIKLKKGDMIYIYSDGYQDQFGGPKGKKYMVKRYRTFLKELSKLPIEEKGVNILEEFHSWKGNHG